MTRTGVQALDLDLLLPGCVILGKLGDPSGPPSDPVRVTRPCRAGWLRSLLPVATRSPKGEWGSSWIRGSLTRVLNEEHDR